MDWKEKFLDVLKRLMLICFLSCHKNKCFSSSCCDTNIIISPNQSADSTPTTSPPNSIKMKRRNSV